LLFAGKRKASGQEMRLRRRPAILDAASGRTVASERMPAFCRRIVNRSGLFLDVWTAPPDPDSSDFRVELDATLTRFARDRAAEG
jgi:hypothetical protein